MAEKNKEKEKEKGLSKGTKNKIEFNPELKTSVEEELILEFEELTEEDYLIIDEFLEALTMANRIKRGRIMKKMKNRIKLARDRSTRRRANTDRLTKRAKKSAIDGVKKRFNPDYKNASAGEKSRVEKMVKRRSGMIDRITKRTIKDKRAADRKRLSSSQFFKGDELSETLNTLYDSINKEQKGD